MLIPDRTAEPMAFEEDPDFFLEDEALQPCPRCGGTINAHALSCNHCGHRAVAIGRINGLAIASLAMSVLFLAGLGSLLGLVLGHRSLSAIRRSGGAESGRSVALVGLVIGYLGLLVVVLTIAATVAGWAMSGPGEATVIPVV